MTKPVCPHCQLFLIELENLDFKCDKCKKEFELVWAGFVEPILKEIK
jgi:tRNA(Ile2) C34 agmatinyltransferase TiaS